MEERNYRLTVLDYNSGLVYVYKIDDMDNDGCEDFLAKKGFKADQMSYMISHEDTFDIFYES